MDSAIKWLLTCLMQLFSVESPQFTQLPQLNFEIPKFPSSHKADDIMDREGGAREGEVLYCLQVACKHININTTLDTVGRWTVLHT